MALVVADLSACRLRVQTWQDPQRRERELLEPGLRRVYGQGRRRYSGPGRAKGERAVAMHEWRKRVKDLRYLGEMLQRRPAPPPAFARSLPGGASAARKGRPDRASEPLRKLARRADGLGEMLGEEHDLAVLAARVRRSHGKGCGRAAAGPEDAPGAAEGDRQAPAQAAATGPEAGQDASTATRRRSS